MTTHVCQCNVVPAHPTYGACLRSKNFTIGFCGQGGGDATRQKQWDRELNFYFDAVKQGVEPAGTKMHQIRDALDQSDKTGVAFDATTAPTLL